MSGFVVSDFQSSRAGKAHTPRPSKTLHTVRIIFCQESPWQTKAKKGRKRKVHEFRPFLANSGVFVLGKTSTIHIELLFRNAPEKKVHELAFLWFFLPGPLLILGNQCPAHCSVFMYSTSFQESTHLESLLFLCASDGVCHYIGNFWGKSIVGVMRSRPLHRLVFSELFL